MAIALSELHPTFGDLDIYLFDQMLKGRVAPGMRVLDAGAGSGRNIAYLLDQGLEVSAVDRDPAAVAALRELAARRAPQLAPDNFREAELDALGFASGAFDVVVAIASLHFARGPEHFTAMLDELWRVLAPRGMLLARIASRSTIETEVESLGDGRYRIPDGTERFLVDVPMLLACTARLGGELLEPLKTVRVEGQRAMATWVLRKRAS